MRSLEPELPPGLLLIGANQSAIELTFEQLTTQMTELVRSLPATSTATNSARASTAGTTGNTG